MTAALFYSQNFTRHNPGYIRVDGNFLYHMVAGQDLLDPAYTLDKIQYPYPLVNPTVHPENPTRVIAALSALQSYGLAQKMALLEPESAHEDDILLAHAPQYVEQVKAVSEAGGFLAEATYLSPESYSAALFSAGAAISAAKGVLEKRFDTALSLGRPPGHHAGIARAGGFCLFNNAAVAAKYCLEKGLCQRVLIIDWDLHHGDGTQDIVQHDPRISFCSLHQFGPELYPESGALEEGGIHDNIINVPLPAKIGDEAYLEVFKAVVPTLIRQNQPDLVIVCAGFDGHFNDVNHLYLYDPGAGFCLTPGIYHTLTNIVAQETAAINAPYVVLLEGGYDLTNLSNSLVNTAAAMLNLPALVSLTPTADVILNSEFDARGYVAKLFEVYQRR